MIPIPIEIFKYIDEHLHDDINKLALKKNPFPNFDWKWILNQIAAKKKAKDKLPTWYQAENIIFPSLVSVEQTSSEELAQFKASLVSGKSFIDLTGGFGIDSYYFAQRFTNGIHCEWNEELSKIVRQNYEQLGLTNMKHVSGDSLDYLSNTKETFDFIFLDPARRDATKKKVFLFEECEPNVVAHIDLLFEKAPIVMVKSSPLVDIHQGIQQLKHVKKIYVVSLKNDVKELLWVLEKDYTTIPEIEAVCIDTVTKTFQSEWQEDELAHYSEPKTYLYEPFSAVMKTGLFNKIANTYQLNKLHQHSHLYTADQLIDFPGRIFKIKKIIPYQKKELKEFVSNQTMNVTIRNFPITVEDLRKKHKIKDGGTTYTFFTTDLHQDKIVVITEKIS